MVRENQGKEKTPETTTEGSLEKFGLALAEWSEKWFPDALVFALVGIIIVFIIGLLLGESPVKLAIEGGKSFWVLVPFTMQMAMVIIGGYVVASSPPVYRLIRVLAGIPKTGRGAVAFVAAFSMITSLLSWGFSLIFSGLLVRELTQRVKGLDYRAVGSAAYLGLGAVWALGLSSFRGSDDGDKRGYSSEALCHKRHYTSYANSIHLADFINGYCSNYNINSNRILVGTISSAG